ncbi:hypothetical protein [Thauera humireducens]|uniref:hypothetical protein n=1 Tax=Thauera humireducens TaxID=1134435 RepID=UPI00311F406B
MFFLPGGWATIWIPASRISSPVSTSSARPPPNSCGEQRPELAIDGIVGFLQLLARLAVDAPDRILERLDRLQQVVGLRIEIALAFGRAAQFVECSEVDRAEFRNLARQPHHFALQRTSASPR